MAIRHDGARTLFVLDEARGLLWFETGESGAAFRGSAKLDMLASDVCVFGSKLMVFGYMNRHIIHEFTRDGKYIRSFGDPFGPRQHSTAEAVVSSDGKIACFPDHNVVIVVPRLFPTVRGYRVSDGRQIWSDSLPEFVAIVLQTLPTGAYSMMPRREGFAETVAFRPLTADLLLVQSRRRLDSGAEIVVTCAMHAMGGGCGSRTNAIPILLAHSTSRVLTLSDTVFPVIAATTMKFRITDSANQYQY
jgi:hypothetical protein